MEPQEVDLLMVMKGFLGTSQEKDEEIPERKEQK